LRDDLRARGVLDMLIAVTDKLTGMPTAVLAGKSAPWRWLCPAHRITDRLG
jgi:hypothetical protein